MYCYHCGKEINDGANYCCRCGSAVQGFARKDCAAPFPRKINGLSVAGLITALASILFGFLAVWINRIHYTGVNFQFFAVVPLAVALVLSIVGTAKSKKLRSGKITGAIGITISGAILLGAIVHYLFAGTLIKLIFTFILFLLAFI